MAPFNCPHCGARYRHDDRLAGRVVGCSQCGEQIRVPDSIIDAEPSEATTIGDVEAPPVIKTSVAAARRRRPSDQRPWKALLWIGASVAGVVLLVIVTLIAAVMVGGINLARSAAKVRQEVAADMAQQEAIASDANVERLSALLADGDGHDWIACNDDERAVLCVLVVQRVRPDADQQELLKWGKILLEELNAFYAEPNMRHERLHEVFALAFTLRDAMAWQTTAQFAGQGIKETESFYVPTREWRVRWEATPIDSVSSFSCYVYRENGSSVAVMTGANEDQSMVRSGPGRHYLSINSFGCTWKVYVEVQQ